MKEGKRAVGPVLIILIIIAILFFAFIGWRYYENVIESKTPHFPEKAVPQVSANTVGNSQASSVKKKLTQLTLTQDGNQKQQYFQAINFISGVMTPIDLEKGMAILKPLAKQGYAPAQNYLALMYAMGKGVPKDQKQAFYWYQQAAKQNLPMAVFALGEAYYYGRGTKENEALGLKYLNQAAKGGLLIANQELAQIKQFPKLLAKAKAGDATAQLRVASMYYSGFGAKQNLREAISWYGKSAQQGNKYAKDFMEKYHQFQATQAQAKENDKDAQLQLADYYIKAYGTPQNYTKAFEILKPFENSNVPDALYLLGKMYYLGNGAPQNTEKGIQLLQHAANLSYTPAQYYLATVLLKKVSVMQHDPQAMVLLKKAALSNYPQAQFQLGFMYMQGINVKANPVEAYAWYSLNAKQKKPYMKQMTELSLKNLDKVMTPQQKQQAQQLLQEYQSQI